jgi:hypothetical protein
MRNRIFVGLGFLLVLLLVGCPSKAVATPTPEVTSTPPSTASFRFYNAGEAGLGDGTYTCTFVDSVITKLEGKVLLEGSPTDWPSSVEWPSEFPPLQAGKILVHIMSSTTVSSYLYCSPGQLWQQDSSSVIGTVDVYYYCYGYVVVKFGNVPIVAGKTTVLPEITLKPGLDDWVFYPE